ncbi:ferredoxin [Spongiibacter nanhainus]|uniref:Ferredoxin n=1 Tax=Spongiibacter nanhainus TaxID=2794344 RepID=A0A7T4R3V6_9GAMM|nr:ferredoxin [Spongiibacter nanhainus]
MVVVKLDKELCCSYQSCMSECPEVFGTDDIGVVRLLMTEIPENYREKVELAASVCPQGVITIERA